MRWVDRVAEERERGMLTERLRILSEKLTDDELMAMQAHTPLLGKYEEVRMGSRTSSGGPPIRNCMGDPPPTSLTECRGDLRRR
jgi:hypothetical protein